MIHLDFSPVWQHVGYDVLTALALLIPFFMAWRLGVRRGLSSGTWLTALAVIFGLMLAGARMGAFSTAEWRALLYSGNWHSTASKTALVGAFLALFGFFLLRRLWHLPAVAADILVLIMPVAAVIARTGCLIAGCCYGTATDLPWGVAYGPAASAWQHQESCGIISPDAGASLPIHPAPAYLIAANVLIFGILWRWRNRFKPGQLAYLGLILIALGRFGTEFFRDAASNPGLTGQWIAGMKTAQWVSLLAAVVTAALWRWRSTVPQRTGAITMKAQAPQTLALWLLPMALLLWMFRLRLDSVETIAFMGMLIPAAGTVFYAAWSQQMRRQHRWVTTALLSAVLGVQLLVPVDTLSPVTDTVGLPTGAVNIFSKPGMEWQEFSGGYSFSRFQDYDATVTGSGCDKQTTVHRDRVAQAQMGALEYSRHSQTGYNHTSWSIRAANGYAKTLSGFPNERGYFYTLGGNTEFDGKWFGGKVGLTLAPIQARTLLGKNDRSHPAVLTTAMRIGLRHRYSFDVAFRERHQFSYYRFPDVSIGLINWGFNDPTGQTWLRIGVGSISSEVNLAWFGAVRFPVYDKKWYVEYGYYQNNMGHINHSLGLRYSLMK